MDTRTIRWLDRNIGRPLCLLLTLHRRLCSIFSRRPAAYKKPVRILFIKLIEQGSTVLAYAALKRAEAMVGGDNIFFLVLKENRPILDILDIIPPQNIIEAESESLSKFVSSIIRAVIRIRREGIDAVVDMEFLSRAPAVLAYLSGADKRAGLHIFNCEGPYRGDLFTHRLLYNPYLHTRLLFLSLVEALDHEPPAEEIPMVFDIPKESFGAWQFIPRQEEKSLLIEKIEQISGSNPGKPIVILNPNIGDLLPIRRWPRENFIRLAGLLLKEFPHTTIIISGSPQEREDAERMASRIKGALSLAGHTSLRELLTLYCIADILITNDSGPAHFSSLTPIKSVIIFGPETPLLYGQMKAGAEVISPETVCSPCINVYNQRQSPCKTGECLKNTGVEYVYERVKALL